eukprot:4393469-Prymnesium_polylepis.2
MTASSHGTAGGESKPKVSASIIIKLPNGARLRPSPVRKHAQPNPTPDTQTQADTAASTTVCV